MGAIIGWLARALQWGGTAAIGYFASDIASWFGKVTGTSRSDNRLPAGIAILLFLSLGAILYLVIRWLFTLAPKSFRR